MTRVLAKDLGRRNITVNTMSPGPTGTDAFFEGKNEQILKTIASWNPSNKIGTPRLLDLVTQVHIRHRTAVLESNRFLSSTGC